MLFYDRCAKLILQFSERLRPECESWEATDAVEIDVLRWSHAEDLAGVRREVDAEKRSCDTKIEHLQVKKCCFGFLKNECFH